MFITNEANRVPIASIFGSVGDDYWRAVELSTHKTWFLLCAGVKDPDGEDFVIRRTFLIDEFAQVEHLLTEASSPEFTVEFVEIVTPGYVNGGTTWRIDRLIRAWSAFEPEESPQNVTIFETKSGCFYTDSLTKTPLRQLLEKKLIVELQP